MQLRSRTIIWKRLDKPGHESARIFSVKSCWNLSGTAVFLHDSQPCRLDYIVKCDSNWQTLSARISGWIGDEGIDVDIAVDANHHWLLNQLHCTSVTGCIDLDLNFSPMTNTLPIRRLNLAVGGEAQVRAAWLKFPSLRLEPLEQVYRRLQSSKYQYQTARGDFVTDLEVDRAGLVINYPNFWQVEDASQ